MNKPLEVPTDGRFPKGKSGNPSGRPIGSRNKSTLLSEQIIGDDLQAITRKLTELAKAGNIHAIKLCLERTIPIQRERTIELPLELARHPSEPPISHRSILIAIANSTITPAEGLAISGVVIAHEDSMERFGFEEDESEEDPGEDLEDLEALKESLMALRKQFPTPEPKVVAKPISAKELEKQRKEELKKQREQELEKQRKEQLEKQRKEEFENRRKETFEKLQKEQLDKLRREELDKQRRQENEKHYREEMEKLSQKDDLKKRKPGAFFG